MSGPSCFLWGSFGSLLPQVNALRLLLSSGQPDPEFTALKLFVAILLLVCGGGMSIAWKPEHPVKAIYVGIAWPYMVSALAHAVW